MSPARTFSIVVSVALWAASAFAQSEFKVYPSTEVTAEGGSVELLIIQTENERFQFRIPKNYIAQIRQSTQSVVLSCQNNNSSMTLAMSTNYAGALPKMEDLRDQVAKKYPTASLVQTSPCHTSCGTGLLFDLFQPAAGNLTMRVRVGYISFPEGSFEFTLLCDSRDYDKSRLGFAWLLNSFRLDTQSAKSNP